MSESRRLNLGCGADAAPGWLNLDGSWGAWLARYPRLREELVRFRILPDRAASVNWRADVVVHDVRRPLPFPSESFDAVYASHLLEHLYALEARRMMAECFRVLKPRGVLRVVVPALERIIAEYLGGPRIGQAADGDTDGFDRCDRFNRRLMLREPEPPSGGLLRRLYGSAKDFHSHKWVYDSEHLQRLFRESGFESVMPRDYLESAIPGIAEVERADRVLNGEGLCVEGRKPLAPG